MDKGVHIRGRRYAKNVTIYVINMIDIFWGNMGPGIGGLWVPHRAGAEAGSSLASSSRPLAQSERAVLSRRDARSKVSTPGFRNGARRTALAPKPLILAVLSPLGDMRDPEKMRVARSEKQTERPAHKLITVCKFRLCNGSALASGVKPHSNSKVNCESRSHQHVTRRWHSA